MMHNITNDRDLIWLAGLLEGEGTFDAHSGKYPRIRVAMTDRDVVGRAASLFGTQVRLTLNRAPSKATWAARVQGAPAAEIMRLILPHMGTRRSAKIAEILALTDIPAGRESVAYGRDIERPPGIRSALASVA